MAQDCLLYYKPATYPCYLLLASDKGEPIDDNQDL